MGVVSQHALGKADPVLSLLVSESWSSHVKPGQEKKYASALKDYLAFCQVRGLTPFPVEPIIMCAWILKLCQRIQTTSLSTYTAALSYFHVFYCPETPWPMKGNELLRRTTRYVKHRYPTKEKGLKIPVTLSLLLRLANHIPGWPNLDTMHYDDLLFLAASTIAVACFLRGGEFLWDKRSERAMLLQSHITLKQIANIDSLVVSVEQPKTRMDLAAVDVPCFSNGGPLDPPRLWRVLCHRSPPCVRAPPAHVVAPCVVSSHIVYPHVC
jgi:hypothetical protein